MTGTALEGRIVAITGASRGLGAAFAHTLAAEGARIALLARPSADLDAIAGDLPDALKLPCDITRPDEVRAAFARIAEVFGRLDALVNNAAIIRPSPAEEEDDAEVQAQVATNLLGPIWCTRSAVPLLRAAGGGDIVNISSLAVVRPLPYLNIYGATKGALESLSAHHREELRDQNIRVTVLRAGSVGPTSIGAEWRPDRGRQYFETSEAWGATHYVGTAMASQTMAGMLVRLLTLPREAVVDVVQVRSI
ncbi:MAG: SDR family oxidoreductase [Gammaproteobacteria bacterium]